MYGLIIRVGLKPVLQINKCQAAELIASFPDENDKIYPRSKVDIREKILSWDAV